MRIAIADFGAYAFTAQLARALARRGHAVSYSCYPDFPGPKAGLQSNPDEPAGFRIEPVSLGEEFQKYNFVRRRRQEQRLGRMFGELTQRFGADAIVSTNMPLEALAAFCNSARAEAAFVYWLQDIASLAIRSVSRQKFGAFGSAIGAYYAWLERRLLRRSDAIVAITPDFFDALSEARLDLSRCHVVPNWAPLEDLPVLPKDNGWSGEHDLSGRAVLLYSGTMGLKHNPDLIVEAASKVRGQADKAVVVVSEGLGADYLKTKKQELELDNLLLLPFQPIERLPEVLAAGDVLTAFVEPGAGVFSVPSKLLTYLCAERAVLLAVPSVNLAARIVNGHDLGIVVEPDDTQGYANAAARLLNGKPELDGYARRARRYAEETFDIERITSEFERILSDAVARRQNSARAIR